MYAKIVRQCSYKQSFAYDSELNRVVIQMHIEDYSSGYEFCVQRGYYLDDKKI